jgi:hypothetical protein
MDNCFNFVLSYYYLWFVKLLLLQINNIIINHF